MTILIEGTAFVLGVLNLNDQGIPFSEADNAIKSLKTSVVRICSRIAPHFCDAIGDPSSEIGHVVDAWLDNDNAICRAEITDSVAEQKISDKTWKPYWSIFGTVDDYDSGGWAHGIIIESISLVDDPAWPEAQYSIISASKDDPKKFHIISPFKILASQPKGDETIPDDPTAEELKQQLAAAKAELDKLKAEAAKVPGLETQIKDLTASTKDLETKLGEKTTMVASLEKKLAESIPLDKFDERLSAAIAKYDEEKEAKNTLAAARAKFVAARKSVLDVDTTDEEFTSLSAADFEKLAADIGSKIEAGGPGSGAGSDPQYPAGGGGGGGAKSPVYDPFTKSYSQGAK
ncbi:MAG: hypothetical protein PHW84_01905 [Methanosarcina sp.]|nr:hypothetical protein [Methanosarcina sp.]